MKPMVNDLPTTEVWISSSCCADFFHNPTCYCFNHGEQGGHGQTDQAFPLDYNVASHSVKSESQFHRLDTALG